MAAAAAQASLGINAVPAVVVQELLTKYKFIPTSEKAADANHRNGHSFVWQEKDAHFRQLSVECTGFAENGGTVYVCGEMLSMLSDDFKLKMERNRPIKFDCSMETFNTVMTFVHSTNCVRPTNAVLLKWMPMFHDCQLPFLADLCAYCVTPSRDILGNALIAAFRAENDLLLQYVLEEIRSRRQLHQLFDSYDAFRDTRRTGFAGEALGRMIELMAILPEWPPMAGAPADPRRVAFNTRFSVWPRFAEYFKHQPDFKVPSLVQNIRLSVGKGITCYVFRPILAQASRYFHQLFYGDFAEQELTSFTVENATAGELECLLTLVFPTAWGAFWRLAPAVSIGVSSKDREFFLDGLYKSNATFGGDPLKFVNVFKLAEYYQITGLVDCLTDVAVHCLPWRQRLQLADLFTSREIMASLLTDDSLKELKNEMASSATVLDEFSSPTKNVITEFLHSTSL